MLAKRLNILIADDNLPSAMSLAWLLRKDGHTVQTCYDGASALAEVLANPSDVMLIDIDLPKMDGWQVARRVREQLPGQQCLLVAVTSHDDPIDRAKSRSAGFDFHFSKPVEPAEFCRFLAAYQPAIMRQIAASPSRRKIAARESFEKTV
jgi:CheY-like chemotaxis protein